MITVKMELLAPLSHGSLDAGDIGNASPIRRLPIVSLPGKPEIPVVSGNALRNRARRIVMRDLFARTGVRDAIDRHAWDRLYAALCNGGHLEKIEPQVKPEDIAALRASLPPLSAWGAALYSSMLAGRMSVKWCWPVCVETLKAGLVPDVAYGVPLLHAEDLVHETSLTRHPDKEHSGAGVTPMPITVETLGTGAILMSSVEFEPEATDVERSAMAYGLERMAQIGGKNASGFGGFTLTHNGDPRPYEEWLTQSVKDGSALASLVSLAGKLSKAKKAKK